LIYGKFLDVDVTPYLEAFETSEHMTTDGYAYLQDAPEPEPSRPVVVRRRTTSSGNRGSLVPFVIGVLVLVIGFTVMKWVMQMQRLKPRPTPAPGSSPIATAIASDRIVAPHAQPADNSTPIAVTPAPTPVPTEIPTVTPSVPAPSSAEPEVRRAEPVHPDEIAKLPTPTPRPSSSPRRSPRPRLSPTPSLNGSPAATVRPR
jgi:hypothetical protein